jgi:hypothetical protein
MYSMVLLMERSCCKVPHIKINNHPHPPARTAVRQASNLFTGNNNYIKFSKELPNHKFFCTTMALIYNQEVPNHSPLDKTKL